MMLARAITPEPFPSPKKLNYGMRVLMKVFTDIHRESRV